MILLNGSKNYMAIWLHVAWLGLLDLDRVRDRLRVPWAAHPIGVETDDEDMKVRDCITH
jgi:hypothetical protein